MPPSKFDIMKIEITGSETKMKSLIKMISMHCKVNDLRIKEVKSNAGRPAKTTSKGKSKSKSK